MLLLHGRFPGRAQLTLDECRRLAREHYPEIRQYDLIRQTAEYTLSNARRAYLPRFGLSAQATWQTAVPDFPDALTDMLARQGVDFPGMDKDQYKLQLELEQTIWDGGQSSADKRIAEAEAAEPAAFGRCRLPYVAGACRRSLFRYPAARRTAPPDRLYARPAAQQPRQGTCVAA